MKCKPQPLFIVLLLAIAVYALVFMYLSFFQFQSFFSFEWEDDAQNNQIIWNTAHNNLMLGQTLQRETCRFGLNDHIEPIFLLLSLPYRVFPHIKLLFFLRALFIAASAIPIYLLVKNHDRSTLRAFLIAITYLLYFPIHYLSLTGLKMLPFCIPFLFFSFYYFDKKNFKLFLTSLLFALMTHELICFSAIMFGLYALYQKRECRWILTPLLIGIIYYILCFYIFIPFVAQPNYSPFDHGIGATDSLWKMLWHIITHPLDAVSMFYQKTRLTYVLKLFSPLLFVSFFSPTILLIGLPFILQIFLSSDLVSNPKAHWLATLVPWIYLSAIFSFFKLRSYIFKKEDISKSTKNYLLNFILILFLLNVFISNFGTTVIGEKNTDYISDKRFILVKNLFDPIFYKADANDKIAWELISEIPDSAPVAATGDLLVALSHRKILKQFADKFTNIDDVEYIAINLNPMYNGNGHYALHSTKKKENKEILLKIIEGYIESGKWVVTFKKSDFYLLKRSTTNTKEG